MSPNPPDVDDVSRNHLFSLTRQIQFSGVVAILFFIALVSLGLGLFQQIQSQTQSYKSGTIFSDRSVSQLQRELLRLQAFIANPSLTDEDAFALQTALVHSRFKILDDSIIKIQPPEHIQAQYIELNKLWDELAPLLVDWQAIENDAQLQLVLLNQLNEIELLVNQMVQNYENLRVDRARIVQQDSERLGVVLIILTIFFLIFVFTVVYNTYRLIQERAVAKEQLAVYTAELERSNQELQQFAYVASHDLQEPLRKVRTFGERLRKRNESTLDKRSLDYVDRMNNAAVRMQALIDDLLAYSRVSTQAAPFEDTDLNRILADVTEDLEARIDELNGRIDANPLPHIEADQVQMRQLLQNLISNGLKFHRDGVPPVVKVESERMERSGRQHVQLRIEDNGIGIEEAYYNRIFELFQRLHGRSQYEGTGIGLAICRRIVERHGGTIDVQSQKDVGTTFTVTLPLTQTV